MTYQSHGLRRPNLLAVSVLVALIAVIGLYAYNSLDNGTPSNASNLSVPGNNIVQTIPVATDSSFDVSCNQCQLGFSVNSGVTITLTVSGSYNTITINGGQTNLVVPGSYNNLYCQNTHLSSRQVSGVGNTVYP